MHDHSESHFQTDCENHMMMMIPDKIEYTNPVGSIQWLSWKGFDISTSKNVEITAGKDIAITAKGQFQVYSPERITASKTDIESSIDMLNNEIHIKAVK